MAIKSVRCLSRKDAATYLGISTRMVDKLRKLGQLPVVRIGRRPLFDVQALDRIVNQSWTERDNLVAQLIVELIRAKAAGDTAGADEAQRRLREELGVTIALASDLGAAA